MENIPFLESCKNIDQTWEKPRHYSLADLNDRENLMKLYESGAIDFVHDQIDLIAEELFEYNHPGEKTNVEKKKSYIDELRDLQETYGEWVYFPWSKSLFRFPDKDDHRALRTSRNRDLITSDEQNLLYDSSIAVWGLSVGSNVVDKLVLSGIGGKLIIGDPDYVAPSNLNRINATFTDVGCSKVDLMARRISESDPWIEQVHFKDGLTEENIHLLEQNMPAVIIEEVDDMRVKAMLRRFAKEHRIPLIMATDLGDRTLVDVERHDIEDIEEFNGRLKQEDVDALINGEMSEKQLTRSLLKLAGMRHMTTRMLESAMKKDKELPGLPQLGTTANTGGVLTAIAAREIILGHKLKSGRYVSSPKSIFGLQPQASFIDALRTISKLPQALK